jgi:hypothetical protein
VIELPAIQRAVPLVDDNRRLTAAGWQEIERLRQALVEAQELIADLETRIEALEP